MDLVLIDPQKKRSFGACVKAQILFDSAIYSMFTLIPVVSTS